jgi:hypothetical protein
MANEILDASCAVARAVKAGDRAAEIRARQDMATALIADRIVALLADAPPLRAEQRDRLAELLRPVRKRR